VLGFFFSILAGALMSVQGVFNSRLTEKIGINETNMLVQGTGFLLTVIILLIWGNGSLKEVLHVNKLYLLGGVIGVGIIYCVIKGITSLGTTVAILAILIAQLLTAALIDKMGWFATEPVYFGWAKIMGLALMIIGLFIFKCK